MASFSIASEDHMAKSGNSSLYAELASDVASHAGLHTGLTIFRCTTCHIGFYRNHRPEVCKFHTILMEGEKQGTCSMNTSWCCMSTHLTRRNKGKKNHRASTQKTDATNKQLHTPYAGIMLFRFEETFSANPAPILATRPWSQQIQAPLVHNVINEHIHKTGNKQQNTVCIFITARLWLIRKEMLELFNW